MGKLLVKRKGPQAEEFKVTVQDQLLFAEILHDARQAI